MSALFDKAKLALKDARAQHQQVSQRLCHGALAVYADAQDKLINSVDKESSWQEFIAAANDGGKSWEDVLRVAGDTISKWADLDIIESSYLNLKLDRGTWKGG
eukprot:6441969-Pyramimonas_sp.AAC.1